MSNRHHNTRRKTQTLSEILAGMHTARPTVTKTAPVEIFILTSTYELETKVVGAYSTLEIATTKALDLLKQLEGDNTIDIADHFINLTDEDLLTGTVVAWHCGDFDSVVITSRKLDY